MSDNTPINAVENVNPEPNKDDIIQDLNKQLEALRSKSSELLAETKQAKQRAREEADAKEHAKIEKAKRDSDFEQLFKSSESKTKTLSEQLQSLQTKISSEKIKTESMRLATELADGPNAELLSEFINKRLRYTDEHGIEVLNSKGELTVSTLDELKSEFQKSDKFKSLLRGIKANGGSAQGSISSANKQTNKQIDRNAFESMGPVERMAFIKDKGTIVDNN